MLSKSKKKGPQKSTTNYSERDSDKWESFSIDINAIKLNASTEMGNNSGSCKLFAFHEMSFYCTLYAVNFNICRTLIF